MADDTTTPRRFVASFLDAAQREDWKTASALLGPASGARNKEQAIERAQQLEYLLERRSWVNIDAISDDPKGTPEDGDNIERIGVVRVAGGEFPIVLERTRTNPPRWAFSAETLARVPAVYEERGPSWLETHVPASLRTSKVVGVEAWQAIGLPLAIVLAIVLGRVGAWLLRRLARPLAQATSFRWDNELSESSHGPLRLALACGALVPMTSALALPSWLRTINFHVLLSLAMCAGIWMALRLVGVVARSLERRTMEMEAEGPPSQILAARGVQTQVRLLRRVASIVILVVGGSLVLMQFDSVRSAGVSLLASAGVAGVVLGLAAQRTIGSVLAGIQLSATQPIRIGDTVVIEGEYGTVEEITLTYAVLKVWDERRIVIPITRILEQPFQNLTKVSSGLIGAVFVHANWTLPIAEVRAELDRILEDEPKWDKRVKVVHLTDARERTIEVRVLVSTASPSDAFALRATVREKLVTWLQEYEGGRHLPRLRVDQEKEIESSTGPNVMVTKSST
ncbi:MAG: mechanosensitive ion channel [Labilithrix sp.]|nr:mechanosensitive ion channel [Labilithrix sp.]MCW5816214.1 mechanosensitive ion channel [Labilithrix sp.]